MGIFSKFKRGLKKGAQSIQGAFASVTGRGKLDEDSLLQIEEAFYESDFGVETTEEILDAIREAHRTEKEFRGEDAGVLARNRLEENLGRFGSRTQDKLSDLPEVVCLIGVNGSGKTTTCAKLAHRLKAEGSKVVLGACDTFRAAATEQLKSWADRLDLDIVSGHHGADSAAVAFDAYSAGESRGCDFVLIDTAGRLHEKGQPDGRTGEDETGFAKTKRTCPSSLMACNRWLDRNERFGAGQGVSSKIRPHGFGRHQVGRHREGWSSCFDLPGTRIANLLHRSW